LVTATQSKEKFLDLSLGKTRFIEAGSGDPVILLHGMGMSNSANTFDTIIPGLAKSFHVLALDQLGFGKGTRDVKEGPTFELVLEHLREFMDTVGVRQANIAGHSMGGWMAAHFAYQSPDRVKKLAMLNAAGLNVQISPGVGGMTQVPPVEKIAGQVKHGLFDQASLTAEQIDHFAKMQHEMLSQPNGLNSLAGLLHIMQTPDLRARYMLHRRLAHIKVPSLVLWGTGDVMDPYPTWTQEYDKLHGDMSKSSKPWVIPGAKYVMVKTGHNTHWEMPEFTVNLLTDFFKGK